MIQKALLVFLCVSVSVIAAEPQTYDVVVYGGGFAG